MSSTNLLKADQVAELLAVPKSWIYTQVQKGDIPYIRLGKYVRFDREEIHAWLNDEEQEK